MKLFSIDFGKIIWICGLKFLYLNVGITKGSFIRKLTYVKKIISTDDSKWYVMESIDESNHLSLIWDHSMKYGFSVDEFQ